MALDTVAETEECPQHDVNREPAPTVHSVVAYDGYIEGEDDDCMPALK